LPKDGGGAMAVGVCVEPRVVRQEVRKVVVEGVEFWKRVVRR